MVGMQEIGRLIRVARFERKLTLEDVARMAKCSATTVSRWEQGKIEIGGEKLVILADQLGFVSQLFPGYKKCSCNTEIVETPVQREIEIIKKRMELIEYHINESFREKERRLLSGHGCLEMVSKIKKE